MKKYCIIVLSIFFLLSTTIYFGCKNDNVCDIYLDKPTAIVDGVEIKISCYESVYPIDSGNPNIQISLIFLNKEAGEKRIKIKNAKIIKNSTEVNYDVQMGNNVEFVLQQGINKTVVISGKIPDSYKKSNYTLLFSANADYQVHLYETPDELRGDCEVKYIINDEVVATKSIKEGRCLSENYIWENTNHLYHCSKWYTDNNYNNEFALTTKIQENIILYGKEMYNFSSTSDSSIIFINDIKHVPSDGIVVLPKVNNLRISNYAIYGNSSIKEIYIPSTLQRVYFGNFEKLPNLAKINFEGSQKEWAEIPSTSTVPAGVHMVFNSKYI